jgi:hypothetical protein
MTSHVAFDNPKSSTSEERRKVSFHGHQEIVVVKVKYLFGSILTKDSHEPDLLSLNKASSSVVHAIVRNTIQEAFLNFIDPGFVQVSDFLFHISSQFTWNLFHFNVYRSQHLIVLLEVSVHLVEESNTSKYRLNNVLISQYWVLFRPINTVD